MSQGETLKFKLEGKSDMFEKNRASNSTSTAVEIPARLTLMSGQEFVGNAISHGTGRLQEILGSASGFVEFRSHDGESRNFNKAAILSLDRMAIPAADQLTRRNPNAPVFDPYQVLGVNADTTLADSRTAYHSMARRYHPDHFENAALPQEVKDYLISMAQRVNLAWETISRAKAPTE